MGTVELKYIIVVGPREHLSAILFPKNISHKTMARIHRANDNDFRFKRGGFCRLVNGIWQAYGKSETTNTEADPEDWKIIQRDWTEEPEL